MKLNNNGWSMKEMILLSSILFAFLLIAVFNIMRLYSSMEQDERDRTSIKNNKNSGYAYTEIERKVLDVGLDYYNEHYNSTSDVKITTDRMKRLGLISDEQLRPKNEDNACVGYVEFLDEEPHVYISCKNYETKGYKE